MGLETVRSNSDVSRNIDYIEKNALSPSSRNRRTYLRNRGQSRIYKDQVMSLFLERALFVVAPQNSGKSTQLRHIFLDRRFGTGGAVPDKRKISETYHLSQDRQLYLRLTSPHEYGETPREFIAKTKRKMGSGRWCFAGPFQPNAFEKMPDVVASVTRFVDALNPERMRVVFLSPNRHGEELPDFLPGRDLSTELLRIPRVEVVCIDARETGVRETGVRVEFPKPGSSETGVRVEFQNCTLTPIPALTRIPGPRYVGSSRLSD